MRSFKWRLNDDQSRWERFPAEGWLLVVIPRNKRNPDGPALKCAILCNSVNVYQSDQIRYGWTFNEVSDHVERMYAQISKEIAPIPKKPATVPPPKKKAKAK